MRKLVAASLLVIVAISVAACGGGGGETTNATSTSGETAVVPAAPAATTGAKSDSRSPTETVSNEPFPRTDKTPADIVTRLDNHQAMILFFYDGTQTETAAQRAALDGVIEKYRGLIDLLPYDINAGASSDPSAKSDEVKKAADLASQIKVNYTPYIVFVDRSGRLTYRFSGFTDQELLEREALRATQ